MSTHYNPALHEEPRNQLISNVLPMVRETLLSWLERTGRFRTDEPDEVHHFKMAEELDDMLDAEVYVLMTEEELD